MGTEQNEGISNQLAIDWVRANKGTMPPEVLKGLMDALKMTPEASEDNGSVSNEAEVPTAAAVDREDPRHVMLVRLFDAGNKYLDSQDYKNIMERGDKEKAFMDFVDQLVPKIDPDRSGNFTDPALWNEVCRVAHDIFQTKVIYPKRGEEFDARNRNLQSVGEEQWSNLGSSTVAKVELAGFEGGPFARPALLTVHY